MSAEDKFYLGIMISLVIGFIFGVSIMRSGPTGAPANCDIDGNKEIYCF